VAHRGLAKTHRGLTTARGRWNGTVRTLPDRLDEPLRWRKPSRVFVDSMSDLFHEDVPDEFIAHVFAVMANAHWHAFQVLTKRPARMREFVSSLRWAHGSIRPIGFSSGRVHLFNHYAMTPKRLEGAKFGEPGSAPPDPWTVPPNVWLGVSAEDQERADERIPELLATPAAVRFVSAEPLLGEVRLLWRWVSKGKPFGGGPMVNLREPWKEPEPLPGIDWVIAGGESGPDARPCDVRWIRSIVEQCREANVPCFTKQLGARVYDSEYRIGTYAPDDARTPTALVAGKITALGNLVLLRDRKGGDPAEWPSDLRVREFPR
jgi:protein gp37